MNKLLKIFVILISLSAPLKGEAISDLIINGNKRVSEETIKIYGEIDFNKKLQVQDIDNIIENLYSTNFFEDISISFKNNILTINVVENPVINQLIITGEKRKTILDQIKKVTKLKENKSYNKNFLAKDIEIIKSLYSSIGYNFAKIESKIKKLENNKIDLLFEINKGNKIKISSISFIGNQNIRTRRLIDVIASEQDKFWKIISKNTNLSTNLISLDKRLLTNFYKSLGYYDIKVTSNIAEINEQANANLIYSINEGERYTISKISTDVDSVYDKEIFFPLKKTFSKYVGDYYSPFKIKEILEELDELIEDNNLQFAEHSVSESIVNNSINITLNVYEGEKKLVERINITGNNITNESVIRGELLLDEGDPYVNLTLEKSIAEIKERNIFKKVNYEVLNGSENNLKIINIDVEEKPTGEISAGAGIGTQGGTFVFSIVENNWLGEGKAVKFDIDFSEESLAGRISYSDPNYNFLGNSLSYFVANESNDKPDQGYENSILSSGVSTSFEQYKDVRTLLGLSASYDDLRTDNSASASLKKQSGEFFELAPYYNFSLDKRDRVFMPTKGTVTTFGQKMPLLADKYYISNTFSSSKYKSFNENIIGAAKLYFTSINGLADNDISLSKRKSLSSKRLRGFEPNKVGPVDGTDHIGGNYAAALNLETNLPNLLPDSTNLDFGLFFDVANVWGVDYDNSLDDSNTIRSSVGANANWLSPIGPMTFTLSESLKKADTDKAQSFTFNLGTTF